MGTIQTHQIMKQNYNENQSRQQDIEDKITDVALAETDFSFSPISNPNYLFSRYSIISGIIALIKTLQSDKRHYREGRRQLGELDRIYYHYSMKIVQVQNQISNLRLIIRMLLTRNEDFYSTAFKLKADASERSHRNNKNGGKNNL